MNLFEKLGLVEKEEEKRQLSAEELLSEINGETQEDYTEEVEIPEDMTLENVLTVDQIYDSFELSDKSASIFKVNEFASVLSKDLTTEAKKASVLGILTVSGLNVDNLISDADNRTRALENTRISFEEETKSIISDKESEITSLEQRIDELKAEISKRKKEQEQQDQIIEEEKQLIEKTLKFIQ